MDPKMALTAAGQSKSKSILKTTKTVNKTLGPQKEARSLTPAKKVTLTLKSTQQTQDKPLMRSTLGELTLNRTSSTRSPYGRRVVPNKKQGRSVFLNYDSKEEPVKAAVIVKEEFVYHLNETVPRYAEYQKQQLEKKRAKKVDLFRDKKAIL